VTIAGSHSTDVSTGPPAPRVTSSSAWSGRFCSTAGSTAYSYTRWLAAALLQLVLSAQDRAVDQFRDTDLLRE
jgi:hypothetical protein